MNLIAENDNANGENPYDFSIVANLTAGNVYYLVSATNGTPSPYTISISNTAIFKYIIENKQVTITGFYYHNIDSELIIPDIIENYPVVAIADNAFMQAYLTRVVIPEGVETIGKHAFYQNDTLEEVVIPATVKTIGEEAFGYYIEKDGTILRNDLLIIGYASSEAERYANDNNFRFENLSCEHTNTIFANYVEATCAAPGYTGDIFCADCGELVSFGTEIPVLECTFGEWTVTTEATCTQEGLKVRVCSLCGKEESEIIIRKAHTIEIIPGKDATCTENGLTAGEKCSVCNTITVEQVAIPAKEHSFGEWTVRTEATCAQEGLKVRVCSLCGKEETETIATKEHNLEHVTIPSTCTVAGVEYDICTECDGSFNSKTLELTEHIIVAVPGKDATCTETGLTDGEKCAECNAVTVEQIVIPAKEHSFGDWTVLTEATCTQEGLKLRACTICSASESETIAVKEAHNLEHVTVPSTCTVAGVEYDICTECDASFNNKTLELADHTSEVIPGKDATCTETGLTDGAKCTVCNTVTVEQIEIPAKGHSFGEWTVTKEATFMYEGEQTKVCPCGESVSETTPKLVAEKEAIDENSNISVKFQDETYAGDMQVTATELFDGSSYQILNNEKGNFNSILFDITTTVNGEKVQPDGMVLVGIPLPEGYNAEETVVYYVANDGSGLVKMNSYYESGIIWFETNHFSAYALVDESAEKPAIVKGDVNGDGQITAADARLVLRASAKLEVLTENEKLAADVVKDNNITAADARLILRVSAKLDSFA